MSSISLKTFPKQSKKRPFSGGRRSFTSVYLEEDDSSSSSDEKLAKPTVLYPVIEPAPSYSAYPCVVNEEPVLQMVGVGSSRSVTKLLSVWASYSTSNKLLLISRQILTTGLKKMPLKLAV